MFISFYLLISWSSNFFFYFGLCISSRFSTLLLWSQCVVVESLSHWKVANRFFYSLFLNKWIVYGFMTIKLLIRHFIKSNLVGLYVIYTLLLIKSSIEMHNRGGSGCVYGAPTFHYRWNKNDKHYLMEANVMFSFSHRRERKNCNHLGYTKRILQSIFMFNLVLFHQKSVPEIQAFVCPHIFPESSHKMIFVRWWFNHLKRHCK